MRYWIIDIGVGEMDIKDLCRRVRVTLEMIEPLEILKDILAYLILGTAVLVLVSILIVGVYYSYPFSVFWLGFILYLASFFWAVIRILES